MIVLVRCDDRLIHGQCMTVITKVNNIDNIIVVDDFTATNAILKRVFRTAVPSNMHANVYTVKESAPVIEKAMADNSKTLVLMKNPKVYV
jgi:mannose/fructose/N-acetylgalactosamine-specific phosphotransferase system component IIB